MELALVVGRVAVAVSAEGRLPVVVEVHAGPGQSVPCSHMQQVHKEQILLGDGDKVRPMRRVDQPVVEVLVADERRGELAVVNPDVGALLRGYEYVYNGIERPDSEALSRTSIFNASPLSASTNEDTMFRTIRFFCRLK
jgi:hypothetical protein